MSSGITKAGFLEWTRRTVAEVAGDGDRGGKVGMDVNIDNIDSNSEQSRKKQSETLPIRQVDQSQASKTGRWSPSIASQAACVSKIDKDLCCMKQDDHDEGGHHHNHHE